MHWLDYLLLFVVAAAVIGAMIRLRQNKKKGRGPCSACTGCPYAKAGVCQDPARRCEKRPDSPPPRQ